MTDINSKSQMKRIAIVDPQKAADELERLNRNWAAHCDEVEKERDCYKTLVDEAVPIIQSMGTMGMYQKQGKAEEWLKRALTSTITDRWTQEEIDAADVEAKRLKELLSRPATPDANKGEK